MTTGRTTAIDALDLARVAEAVAADQVIDGSPTPGFAGGTSAADLGVDGWGLTVGARRGVGREAGGWVWLVAGA